VNIAIGVGEMVFTTMAVPDPTVAYDSYRLTLKEERAEKSSFGRGTPVLEQCGLQVPSIVVILAFAVFIRLISV
jgi:hypothetical protein